MRRQDLAGLPGFGFGVGEGVEVDALGTVGGGVVGELGPGVEVGWVEVGGALPAKDEVGVAGGGAVGDHGDGEVSGVGGEVEDFDVEDGGEAAEALCANAELVDLVEDFDAELFDVGGGVAGGDAGLELLHVDGVHEGLLGEEHGFLRGCRRCRCPTCQVDTSRRPWWGTVLRTQSTMESEGLSMTNLDLASEPPPLAATVTSMVLPGTRETSTTQGGVVDGVLAGEGRVGEDAAAEFVVGVEPGAAHALVAELLQGLRWGVAGVVGEADVETELEEDGHDAGVLADGAVAFGAHAGVDEDLLDGVFGGGGLFELVGAGEVGDVVDRVIEADVL